MGKAWEEEWSVDVENDPDGYPDYYVVAVDADGGRLERLEAVYRETDDVARLAAAAPEMARSLLAVEWAVLPSTAYTHQCPACSADKPTHASGCELDAALTAAGLPTQAERDEARKASGR